MSKTASVSTHASLNRGQSAAHHGKLDFHHFGPR
jgi:hypothetical protein